MRATSAADTPPVEHIDPRRRLVLGAVAGTLSTVPMSGFMLLARRAGLLDEQAPERITRLGARNATGAQPNGAELDVLTAVVHFATGAAAGAAYASVLEPARPQALPPALAGAAFGSAFWLVSYWGVLPALGLMPTPPRDQRLRPQVMLAAHWIFGGVLGLVSARLTARARPAHEPVR